jgi:hypothetical protein
MPMPTTLAGPARSSGMRPLHTDDRAACLALWCECDGVAVRMWEDASAKTRLIGRNAAMSCAAEVAGRLVARCSAVTTAGAVGRTTSRSIPHGADAALPRR